MIMQPTLQTMADFASAVWYLAREEPMTGQIAVAHAITNLLRSKGHPADNTAVADMPWCQLPRICRDLIANAGVRANGELTPGFHDPAYCLAFSNVCVVVSGQSDDPTRGATHFHRHDRLPPWARDREPLALIGSWFFYSI